MPVTIAKGKIGSKNILSIFMNSGENSSFRKRTLHPRKDDKPKLKFPAVRTKHSRFGKALIGALTDIKKGNVTVIWKENLKREIHKLLE